MGYGIGFDPDYVSKVKKKDKFRENYDRIFKKKERKEFGDPRRESCYTCGAKWKGLSSGCPKCHTSFCD